MTAKSQVFIRSLQKPRERGRGRRVFPSTLRTALWLKSELLKRKGHWHLQHMAVVLLSVFGEAIQGSTNIRDQCEWIRYKTESIYIATGASVWHTIKYCFVFYHITLGAKQDSWHTKKPLNMGLGAEPGPRWHKGEFHCSVELTAAQKVTDHFNCTRKISFEREQTLLCPFFLHILILWHLQRHCEIPSVISLGLRSWHQYQKDNICVLAVWGTVTEPTKQVLTTSQTCASSYTASSLVIES